LQPQYPAVKFYLTPQGFLTHTLIKKKGVLITKLVSRGGKIPTERIDHNLRVGINWLCRLTVSEQETEILLEQLMFEGK